MALLGFDVSCACYSKYLSVRDKLSFSKLITILNLNQYIEYGTFNEICESLISKKGNVRDLTLKILNEDEYPKLETVAYKRLRVLIIDEYDTLLNNSLYLNMFNPSSGAVSNTALPMERSPSLNKPLSQSKNESRN